MKKILGLFFVAITAIALVACGKKEYSVDGTFTAFEVSMHTNGGAQVTWVDVTIEKGKVVKYFIDARQSDVNKETGAHSWKAKTKKELKEEYGMKGDSAIEKEWYEQAETLEVYFLENGADKVTTKDGYINNVTGVSIKDGGYTKLALAALENAKKGIATAFEVSMHTNGGAQVTWVDVTIEKGKVVKYFIDARQSDVNKDTKVRSWKTQTKKELKEAYGMKGDSAIEKEWYEQAETLEKFFLEQGADKVTTKDGYINNVTGVSIKDGGYTKLAKAALVKVGK